MKHVFPVPLGENHAGVPARGNWTASVEQLRDLLADPQPVQITEDHLYSLLNVRRGREALFGRHLFSDPAWDLLLELYAARLGNRQVSASQLARSIAVPEAVMGRWVEALVEAGLVVSSEPLGGSTALELSREGEAKMARLASQWSSAFRSI